MPKPSNVLTATALALALAWPASAQTTPSAETVVATVDGRDITLGHVIVAYQSLPQQYKQIPPDRLGELYQAIIGQLIQQSVLQEAQGDETPPIVALQLENEERSLLAAAQIESILASAVTDEAVQALYDETYGEGYSSEEFNASHILVASEEEATAIKEELDGGADFAALAKDKSTGPSGPNGGSLGWFGPGQMVPAFEEAVVALEPGQVSDPVQTQFGWHVILLSEKRQADAPPLDEVRGELEQQVQQKVVAERIDELVAAADVERPEVEGLDPSAMQNLGLLED